MEAQTSTGKPKWTIDDYTGTMVGGKLDHPPANEPHARLFFALMTLGRVTPETLGEKAIPFILQFKRLERMGWPVKLVQEPWPVVTWRKDVPSDVVGYWRVVYGDRFDGQAANGMLGESRNPTR